MKKRLYTLLNVWKKIVYIINVKMLDILIVCTMLLFIVGMSITITQLNKLYRTYQSVNVETLYTMQFETEQTYKIYYYFTLEKQTSKTLHWLAEQKFFVLKLLGRHVIPPKEIECTSSYHVIQQQMLMSSQLKMHIINKIYSIKEQIPQVNSVNAYIHLLRDLQTLINLYCSVTQFELLYIQKTIEVI